MKIGMRSFGALISLLAVLVLAAGCGGGGSSASAQQDGEVPEKLVMGVIPSEDNSEMLRAFGPVGEHLGQELGTEVELFTATDYTGIIEAMRSGEVDVAWFGPLSYVLAADVADAEAIAVQLKEEGGTPTYHSLMITRPDSGITDVTELGGKRFSFVEPASTSGYLFPSKALNDAGIDPENGLDTTFAGGHDASALAVKNGTVDAGAVADNTLEKMIEEGVIEEGEVEVIHESEEIPESPIAVRADLPQDLKDQIKEIFLDMTEESVGAPIGSDKIAGYLEATDEDYNVIRDLATTLDLDLEEAAK